jgi:hypothetical protein
VPNLVLMSIRLANMCVYLQWVGSIDLFANEDADANVVVAPSESWIDQETTIRGKIDELVGENKLDAVLCVAGGWAGGNAASKGMCCCITSCNPFL